MTYKIRYIYILVLFFFISSIFGANIDSKTRVSDYHPNQLLVKLKNSDKIYKFNFIHGSDLNAIRIDYKKNIAVNYVEPNYIYYASLVPQDPFYYKLWYINQINADPVWDKAQGEGVLTAVLDSGVDIHNPDIINNIWTNPNEIPNDGVDNDKNGYVDDINGWDFVDHTNDVKPKFEVGYTATGVNHGTIIAGVIGAEGNNSQGVIGIAWKGKIMPLRVLDSQGSGDVVSVARAIDYAVAQGASIINMSFVGTSYSQTVFDSIKRAYDKGVILLAAAGNKTKDISINLDETLLYPICYDSGENVNRIIGVTGLDTLDQKPPAFNFGSRCVDISAPGVSFYGLQVYNPQYGHDEYQGGLWSGTSIATAVVSGSAAVLKSYHPNLTNKEIIELLIRTTDNIDGTNPTMLKKLGSGRVNLLNAINVLANIPSGQQAPAVPQASANPIKIIIKVKDSELKNNDLGANFTKLTLIFEEFNRIYGRSPTEADRDNFNKLSLGLQPNTRSFKAEKAALKHFGKIFKRSPKSKQDWFFINITAYGLKQFKRDLVLESKAIQTFKRTYKHLPKTNYEWNIVRGIAYRQSVR